MKPSFLIFSLLVLSLLLSETQGIRLGKDLFMSAVKQNQIHEENPSTKTSSNGAGAGAGAGVGEGINLCKDGHCSGTNRKLMISTTVTPSSSTSTTTSKNEKKKNGKKEQIGEEQDKSNSFNSLSTSDEHPEGGASIHYSDVVDLAEMDYSPARRKTPIHN